MTTSTCFAPSGATLDELRLIRASVSPRVPVKAAGGRAQPPSPLDVLNSGTTCVVAMTTATIRDDFHARRAQQGAGHGCTRYPLQ